MRRRRRESGSRGEGGHGRGGHGEGWSKGSRGREPAPFALRRRIWSKGSRGRIYFLVASAPIDLGSCSVSGADAGERSRRSVRGAAGPARGGSRERGRGGSARCCRERGEEEGRGGAYPLPAVERAAAASSWRGRRGEVVEERAAVERAAAASSWKGRRGEGGRGEGGGCWACAHGLVRGRRKGRPARPAT